MVNKLALAGCVRVKKVNTRRGLLHHTALCLTLIWLILLAHTAIGQVSTEVASIKYVLWYDIIEDTGMLLIRASVDTRGEIASLEIPLAVFEAGYFEYLNYTTAGNLSVLGLDYDNATNSVRAYVYGSGLLEVAFSASNLLEGTRSYCSMLVDLTVLKDIAREASLEIVVPGIYKVYVNRFAGNASFTPTVVGNLTRVVISGFAMVELLFELELEVTGVPATGTAAPLLIPTVVLALLLVVAVAGIVAYYLVVKRRALKPTVEYRDYITDHASRLIIKALGDAGKEGLAQSDLVKKTGLPKSSVSRRLKRLEEDGLVEIKRVGKTNYLVLTPKGIELYKKISGEGGRERIT